MPDLRHRHKHHTKANAQRQAKANADDASREKGGGSVEIDGDAAAQPGAPLTLAGARPGVDGTYQIASASHTYRRGGGWTVRCEVKLPGSGTGQDNRAAGSAASHGT